MNKMEIRNKINEQKYVLSKEESDRVENIKDDNGNQKCNNVVNCHNSTRCHNSTGCHNSTWCHNSTECHNSTWCDNSTWCHNSAYLMYCNELILEKHCLFNKQVSKERYKKQTNKIREELGLYKHPLKLTDEDKEWLKNNISEYDEEVLSKVIDSSILPNNHKEQ